MPFMLYDTETLQGTKRYTYSRNISIAGNTGPLAAIQRSRNAAGAETFRWHATCGDIVSAIPDSLPTQEIVIDLKPNVANNVSLYRLLDVWGYSYPGWTPLALRLEVLFVDFQHDDPARLKESFSCEAVSRDRVGEFLYVQGGTRGGTWNWGQVGSVNGALLWRDAFDYLSGELSKTL